MTPRGITEVAAIHRSHDNLGLYFKSSTSQGSSESFSDSSTSFSDSSGSSSGERGSAFLRDVRAYAARFVRDGGQAAELDALERDLGELARGHGILDWEGDDATFLEIGTGFAAGGAGEQQFATLAERLAGANARRRSLLYHGYASHTAE